MAPRNKKPIKKTETATTKETTPLTIAKPSDKFDLNKFKSKRPPTIAGVETLLTALPVMRIADANDWFGCTRPKTTIGRPSCASCRSRSREKRDMLHLIDEDIAMQYLPAKKIKRQRLALACEAARHLLSSASYRRRTWTTRGTRRRSRPASKAKTQWVQACLAQGGRRRGLQDRVRARPGCLSRSEMAVAHARRADRGHVSRTPTSTPTIIRHCCA